MAKAKKTISPDKAKTKLVVDIGADKKEAHEVRQARDFAEAVIDTLRDPLLILDAELRVLMANEAFLAAFKISTKAVMGRKLEEIDRGCWDIPKLGELLSDIIPRRTTFDNFEVTHQTKRSGHRAFLLNARLLTQQSGQRKKILLGIQDVTELQSTQTRLRESELHHRRLFEAAHEGVLILDPGSRKITDANPFMTQLLGYSRDQLVGKELFEIGLLKDEAASRAMFRKLKRNHEIRYENLPLQSQTGRHQEVEVVANLYEENSHSIIQCHIRDITQRKHAEDALRSDEALFAALIDQAPMGVYVVDADFRMAQINPKASPQFRKIRPLIGRDFGEILNILWPPQAAASLVAQFRQTLRTGEAYQSPEFTERRQDTGKDEVYFYQLQRITLPSGEQGVACFFNDITERKQTEAALHVARVQLAEHANMLEKTVTARTAELVETNQRLSLALDSTRTAEKENRRLLLESQRMQKKLQQLTHQILTAQEEERKRISRELHDDVIQTLVAINIDLSIVVKTNFPDMKPLKAQIVRTQRLLMDSVDSLGRFAYELRPTVLDDLGLVPALRAFCNDLKTRVKLKIKLTAFDGVEALDIDVRIMFFRVAQEALNNIVKHAGAEHAEISIRQLEDAIQMEIGDDGKSFQVAKVLHSKNNKRLGLLGMKERVGLLGGTLEIKSKRGEGTTVRAQIPYNPRKGKAAGS